MVLEKLFSTTKIETGMPYFDQITGGGFPRPAAIALIGGVDGGKELLIRQIIWKLLQKGAKVLYYSVSQSAEELRYDMQSYGWDVKPFEKKGALRIVDVFTHASERMSKEFMVKESNDFNFNEMGELSFHKDVYDLNMIYDEGKKFIPVLSRGSPVRIAVFDSISPLFSTNTEGVFQMIHGLKFATRLSKAIGVGIMHSNVHDKQTEETFKSLADAIIEVDRVGTGTSSYVVISKYPGEHKRGPFPFETSRIGGKIIPVEMPDLIM
ncbi:MAG: hypothetical protein JSV20_02720 [Candidatus Bathyarchaeota archaeon]|nr:MAG: hypothetical protein JSV20_02720 [Candidatus Bathyarchaeota archaeon]